MTLSVCSQSRGGGGEVRWERGEGGWGFYRQGKIGKGEKKVLLSSGFIHP